MSVESSSGVYFVWHCRPPWIVKPVFGLSPMVYRLPVHTVPRGTGSNLVGESGNSSSHAYGCNGRYCSWFLSVAISDVIVDSLVVERARAESQAEAGSLSLWGLHLLEA